jgi:hypothetical protein
MLKLQFSQTMTHAPLDLMTTTTPRLGSCCKLKDSKELVHTLLAAFTIITSYLMSSTSLHSLRQKSFNHSFGLENSKTSTRPMHTLHDFVIYFHFCWYKNNGISHEISEIKLRILSTHSFQTFSALLVGILRMRNN